MLLVNPARLDIPTFKVLDFLHCESNASSNEDFPTLLCPKKHTSGIWVTGNFRALLTLVTKCTVLSAKNVLAHDNSCGEKVLMQEEKKC